MLLAGSGRFRPASGPPSCPAYFCQRNIATYDCALTYRDIRLADVGLVQVLDEVRDADIGQDPPCKPSATMYEMSERARRTVNLDQELPLLRGLVERIPHNTQDALRKRLLLANRRQRLVLADLLLDRHAVGGGGHGSARSRVVDGADEQRSPSSRLRRRRIRATRSPRPTHKSLSHPARHYLADVLIDAAGPVRNRFCPR